MPISVRKIGLGFIKKFKFIPIKPYLEAYYEYYVGKKLDLDNPVEFNQKIQWYKAYYRVPLLTQLVDKYSVRSYVKEKIGEQYLNEVINIYDNASKVDFTALPNQFVIKGVHGCHFNLIVSDKTNLNISKSKFLLHKWMSKNQYYRGGREWAYKDVKPRLMAEKYLSEMDKDVINDYKFFCFNGQPKFVEVDIDRGNQDYMCFYDLNWSKLPFTKGNKTYEGDIEKPDDFDKMIDIAIKLADNLPFVRVDLYNINGKIIFGEMTFYPADGRSEFSPDKYNKIIGDYLTLPKIPKGQNYITNI